MLEHPVVILAAAGLVLLVVLWLVTRHAAKPQTPVAGGQAGAGSASPPAQSSASFALPTVSAGAPAQPAVLRLLADDEAKGIDGSDQKGKKRVLKFQAPYSKPYTLEDLGGRWVDVPGHGKGWQPRVFGTAYTPGDPVVARGVVRDGSGNSGVVQLTLWANQQNPGKHAAPVRFAVERSGSVDHEIVFDVRA